LIGTNDLPWYEYRHDELILGTYQEISKRSIVILHHQSIRGISAAEAHFQAKRIRQLNPKLKKLTESMGMNSSIYTRCLSMPEVICARN